MKPEENVEKARTKTKKFCTSQTDSVVVFLVLPVILTLLVPTGGILYIYGRLSRHPGFMMMTLFLPSFSGMVVFFFIGIVRLIRWWKKCNWKGKLVSIAEIVVPVVFVVLFMVPFFVPAESKLRFANRAFTYGFRDRVESKADIPAIRAWLKTLNPEDYFEHGDRVPRDEWPESLKVLNPGIVHVLADKNGNFQTRFMWGGAIFHWGLTIGVEEFRVPTSELNDRYEAWLLVQPGVYVYDW